MLDFASIDVYPPYRGSTQADVAIARHYATVNRYGKGHAYYFAFRDTGDFTRSIVDEILQNYTYEPQYVQTSLCWKNIETGDVFSGRIELQPLQALILVK